mmetsp:Transcript_9128/g.23865  ORF Transcript_9128/g.23865 Transcript_9128/m.23865 type:complete len:220 (+) Transcript_9128:95-754(+)
MTDIMLYLSDIMTIPLLSMPPPGKFLVHRDGYDSALRQGSRCISRFLVSCTGGRDGCVFAVWQGGRCITLFLGSCTGGRHFSFFVRTFLLQARLCGFKVHAPIGVRLENVGHIGRVTTDMNVLTTNRLNETGRSPHADAPTVPIVSPNVRVPLECLLTGNLPKIALSAPGLGLTRIQELRANAMRSIVVALVILIPVPLAWAHLNVSNPSRAGADSHHS